MKVKSPTRRSGRVVKSRANTFVPSDQRWSFQERKALLEGLKKHGSQNLLALQTECVPQRQIADIENFLHSMKTKAKQKPETTAVTPPVPEFKLPIEMWTTEAEALTRNEHDFSYVLADMCSIFSNIEPHDQVPSENAPSWAAIYGYLASLLRSESPKTLKPIEAQIVVDILESLAVELQGCDTNVQEELMRQKHRLLTAPAIIHDKRLSQLRLRQALEEDTLLSTTSQARRGRTNETPTSSTATPRHSATTQASSSFEGQATPSSVTSSHIAGQTPIVLSQVPGYATPMRGQGNISSCDTPHTVQGHATIPGSSQNTQGQVNVVTGGNASQPSTSGDTPSLMNTPKSVNQRTPGSGDLRPRRTPLYSLNPFYIPIKYLPLR